MGNQSIVSNVEVSEVIAARDMVHSGPDRVSRLIVYQQSRGAIYGIPLPRDENSRCPIQITPQFGKKARPKPERRTGVPDTIAVHKSQQPGILVPRGKLGDAAFGPVSVDLPPELLAGLARELTEILVKGIPLYIERRHRHVAAA